MVLFVLFSSEAHIRKIELFSQVIEKKEKKLSKKNFRILLSKPQKFTAITSRSLSSKAYK